MCDPQIAELPYDRQIDRAAGELAKSVVFGLGCRRSFALKLGALLCGLLAPAQFFSVSWF